MTTVDVLFRYELHPSETAMFAIGKLSEVYGIRRIQINEEWKTVRVEYDATRLTVPVVGQLLRRAGLTISEELPLIPPQPAATVEAVPAPAK